MTGEQFKMWLEGYLEGHRSGKPTKQMIDRIREQAEKIVDSGCTGQWHWINMPYLASPTIANPTGDWTITWGATSESNTGYLLNS